jgi:hypothetical protein
VQVDFLKALEEEWQPVSRAALIGWLVFYGLFLLHALTDRDGFLLIDNVNLVVHEGGHLLFGWFGYWIGIAGGTLLELLVPLALAGYFIFRRQTVGAAFAAFFFFENFLYISVYMADARRQVLPLVSTGGGNADHDWYLLFSHFGVLRHDTAIAQLVRLLGWLGMLATVAWLVYRARHSGRARAVSD